MRSKYFPTSLATSCRRLLCYAVFSFLCLTSLLPFSHQRAYGQASTQINSLEASLSTAYELFYAKKYAAAQQAFKQAMAEMPKGETTRRGDAAFYQALCAVHLGRSDALPRITSFLNQFPENSHCNQAKLTLANSLFAKKDYATAIQWYDTIDSRALDEEQNAEKNFKTGYSHIQLGDTDAALVKLAEVKDTETYYWVPATYFYGHIAYENGNLSTALREFKRIEDDPSFSPIVPYYIAHIEYRNGNYQALADYLEPRIDSVVPTRRVELLRILGDAQLRTNQNEKAGATWARFLEENKNPSREDHYLIGLVNQRSGQYAKAIEHLEKVSIEQDSLAQNANYHLAACYLQNGQKENARSALALAARADFDSVIKEDALFNYGKLSLELPGTPGAEAIEALQQYCARYPNSERINQAYSYLGIAFSATQNYQQALEMLDKIKTPDALTLRAKQRAAYFRGIELFQNFDFPAADSLFALALATPNFEPTIHAQSLYWHAETLYRLKKYPTAAKFYLDFLRAQTAYTTEQYPLASYNLGYCYFKMESYAKGAEWFEQYTTKPLESKPDLLTDAYCRLGDCRYMLRTYWPAVEAYKAAAKLGGSGADYALYQQGFTLGLVDRPKQKVETLRSFGKLYPQSPLHPEVLYELGNTLQAQDQLSEAAVEFKRITQLYPTSPQAPGAFVQLGLVAYAQNDLANAEQAFRKAIKDYPNTPQKHEAIAALERVYQTRGNTKAYLNFIDSLGLQTQYSVAQRDSLIFSNAESLYFQSEYPRALVAFKEYLQDYPHGLHAHKARLLLAETHCSLRDSTAALPLLRAVNSQPGATPNPRALLLYGEVLETQKEWAEAERAYTELEKSATNSSELRLARTGKLRVAIRQNNRQNIIDHANSLLATEKLPPEQQLFARYHLGKAQLETNRLEEAYSTFASIGQNTGSITGAEARFQMANIRAKQKDWNAVKREVTAFAQQNTPHQYWLARAFILLAQGYLAQDDSFQAKATLQSVIDNYNNNHDGVVKEANELLNSIITAEKRKLGTTAPDTIHFQFE